MKGPTIWRLPCGSARRTSKPSPRSRVRGTMTSSSASQDADRRARDRWRAASSWPVIHHRREHRGSLIWHRAPKMKGWAPLRRAARRLAEGGRRGVDEEILLLDPEAEVSFPARCRSWKSPPWSPSRLRGRCRRGSACPRRGPAGTRLPPAWFLAANGVLWQLRPHLLALEHDIADDEQHDGAGDQADGLRPGDHQALAERQRRAHHRAAQLLEKHRAERPRVDGDSTASIASPNRWFGDSRDSAAAQSRSPACAARA